MILVVMFALFVNICVHWLLKAYTDFGLSMCHYYIKLFVLHVFLYTTAHGINSLIILQLTCETKHAQQYKRYQTRSSSIVNCNSRSVIVTHSPISVLLNTSNIILTFHCKQSMQTIKTLQWMSYMPWILSCQCISNWIIQMILWNVNNKVISTILI